jgi:hypothetical protein
VRFSSESIPAYVGGITTVPAPPHALIAGSVVEYFSPSTKQRWLTLGEGLELIQDPLRKKNGTVQKKYRDGPGLWTRKFVVSMCGC